MPQMSRCVILLTGAALFVATGLRAEPALSSDGYRTVTVMNDSEAGWVPSEDLEAKALATLTYFETALAKNRQTDAYELFGPGLKQMLPLAQFRQQQQQFSGVAGKQTDRRVLLVSWTKGSSQQPLPGIYAAIDVSYKFERVSRHCGFVILHAVDGVSPFEIERTESNFLDDAQAARIAQAQSPAERDRLWAEVSANCPNYKPW